MTDYENLKKSYITAMQLGLQFCGSYDEAKRGNDILHQFCKTFVENSQYGDYAKDSMKQELEVLKVSLLQEIKLFFHEQF